MAAWCDDDHYNDRREAYALHADTEPLGGYYEDSNWFDWGAPDTVVQELCAMIDRATLDAERTADMLAGLRREIEAA